MAKIFNHKHMKKLDSEGRRAIIPPEIVLDALALAKDDTLLDIGAGTGYFAIPALQVVGVSGKVIAADISEMMLEELKTRIPAGIANVEFVQCAAEKIPLPDNSVDKILVAFVFHEIEDQKANLTEVKRLLKKGGSFMIVEWAKEASTTGPPLDHRIGYDKVLVMVEELGLEKVKHQRIGDSIYMAVFAEGEK